MWKKVLVAAIVIGASLIAFSLSLDPYLDEGAYYQNYSNIERGDSDAFYQLRGEMISPKYRLFDTGLTFILVAVLFSLFRILGKGRLVSPGSKLLYVLLAVTLPLLSAAAFVFELHQGFLRNEYPNWADSLSIPLFSVPPMFAALLIWSLSLLTLLKKGPSRSLSFAISRKFNPGLALLCVLTLLILLDAVFYGRYWYAVPALLWIYYYLSLGVSRIEPLRLSFPSPDR